MCWYCGSAIKDSEPLGRSLKCPDCGKDLRSCRHCRHYRPSGCAESNAEKPSDIERANFCDWFSLDQGFRKITEGAAKIKDSSANAGAKSAFDKLFD